MSFLKSLGSIALTVGRVAPVVGPILSALIPGTADDVLIAKATGAIDPIVKIIGDVEKMSAGLAVSGLALTGPQKLAAATVLVTEVMTPYAATLGIADPVLFKVGCEKIAAGTVDVLNSLKAPA